MPVTTSDVLSLVKSRLQITDNARDALITGFVEELEQRILSFCNIDAVPDGLKFVWASMTIDVLKVEQQTLPEVAAATPVATEIKLGDTTVKEAVGTAAKKSALDDIVLNYRIDLNRYRKLRW